MNDPLEIYDGTVNIRPLGSGKIARGSDNLIELVGLYGELSATYPTTATVTFTLTTAWGEAVAGATNVTMSYVSGSLGRHTTYRGELPATVSRHISPRIPYLLTVHVVDENQNIRDFVLSVVCPV